jgi:hypothetical protein
MTVHGARMIAMQSRGRAGQLPAGLCMASTHYGVTVLPRYSLIGFYKISNAWMNLAIMVGPAAGQGLPRNFGRLGRFGGTHGATARIKYLLCHVSHFAVFMPVAGMITEGLKRVLISHL